MIHMAISEAKRTSRNRVDFFRLETARVGFPKIEGKSGPALECFAKSVLADLWQTDSDIVVGSWIGKHQRRLNIQLSIPIIFLTQPPEPSPAFY